MTNTTTTLVLIAGFALAGASRAAAQTKAPGTAYVDVNIGGQTSSRTLSTSSTFTLYEETATTSTSQTIGSGAMFDIGGGYRFWNNLAAGISFSTFSKTAGGSVSARIPDPVFFDRFTNVDVAAPGLKRSEFGTHIKLVYFIAINDKLDVAVSGGPSFIHVSQDLSTVSVPSGTQTVTVGVVNQTGTATGGNIGADVNYMITPRYGAGFFLRYAGGSVDLAAAPNVKAGGVQIGVGGRVRF